MSVSSPKYRLPAEWEPQTGVMLTWPHTGGDWVDILEAVEPVFLAIAEAVARRENLLVNCADAAQAGHVKRALLARGVSENRLFIALSASNDSWARDHGPLAVTGGAGPRLLDFRFNGWGNKYPAAKDNAINRGLADAGWFGLVRRLSNGDGRTDPRGRQHRQ